MTAMKRVIVHVCVSKELNALNVLQRKDTWVFRVSVARPAENSGSEVKPWNWHHCWVVSQGLLLQ